MRAERVGLLLLMIGASLGGCTPHREPDSQARGAAVEIARADPPAPVVAEAEPRKAPPSVPAEQERSIPEPTEPEIPPELVPPPAVAETESVHPSIRVWFEESDPDMGAEGFVKVEDIPAYDPTSQQVIVLETYARKMSPEREATLRWYDANTGDVVREDVLLGDDGESGWKKANRRARRLTRDVNRALDEGSWESMALVPLRRVHEDEYSNFRGELPDDATEEDREVHADWAQSMMPSGQVHVVPRADGTVVRLPGVKVYERDVSIYPNTLSTLVGHRPSGVVAAIHANCRDEEDCTCNLEDRVSVMQWSAATLAAIDLHPCMPDEASDDDFACTFGSIFDG